MEMGPFFEPPHHQEVDLRHLQLHFARQHFLEHSQVKVVAIAAGTQRIAPVVVRDKQVVAVRYDPAYLGQLFLVPGKGPVFSDCVQQRHPHMRMEVINLVSEFCDGNFSNEVVVADLDHPIHEVQGSLLRDADNKLKQPFLVEHRNQDLKQLDQTALLVHSVLPCLILRSVVQRCEVIWVLDLVTNEEVLFNDLFDG